jgi:hypothetical protein
MDERLKEQTRSEWRALGFFYDRDDNSKEWLLIGSRAGLLRFAALLRAYVADPRNEMKSEHEHYGPYMYLEVMTWPETGMDDHTIHGPLDQLQRLAILVDEKVSDLEPGTKARIRDEFAPGAEYSLVLDLRPDNFDPASTDTGLT